MRSASLLLFDCTLYCIRLLDQLEDLERSREELGEEEYQEMRQDTMEQVVTTRGV